MTDPACQLVKHLHLSIVPRFSLEKFLLFSLLLSGTGFPPHPQAAVSGDFLLHHSEDFYIHLLAKMGPGFFPLSSFFDLLPRFDETHTPVAY